MNTDDLMQLALDLIGWESLPADSAVYVPGNDLRRVLMGLDIGTAELLMARQMGYDAVIAHHPVGLPHRVWPVYLRHVDLMTAAGVPEEADLERLQAEGRGQLIVTGHIVGDPFGIAPYIQALRARGLQVDLLSHVLDPAG